MLGSALVGAGASLLSNIFGGLSNSSTNKTNLKIAQMNNEFNERMLDKQMDYNRDMYEQQWADQTKQTWDMWNANNDYNSATKQVERLRAAGLNPALTYGSGASGMASGSGGSAPSALGVNTPTAQQVNMRPYDFDLSGISGVIQTLLDIQAQKKVRDAQADNLTENSAGVRIENQYRAERILNDIYETGSRRFLNESQEKLNNMSFARAMATFSSDVERSQREAENAKYTGELLRAQTAYQQLQGQLTAKDLAVYDKRFLQQMAVLSAQQYSLVAAGKASEAQARQAIENALNLEEQRKGIKIDNYVKENTKQALIDTAKNNSGSRDWPQFLQRGINLDHLNDRIGDFLHDVSDQNIINQSKKFYKKGRKFLLKIGAI